MLANDTRLRLLHAFVPAGEMGVTDLATEFAPRVTYKATIQLNFANSHPCRRLDAQ